MLSNLFTLKKASSIITRAIFLLITTSIALAQNALPAFTATAGTNTSIWPTDAVYIGTPCTFKAMLPTDRDDSNTINGSTLTCTWNFGDGSSTVVSNSVNHSYSSAGTYTVSATFKDPAVGARHDSDVTVTAGSVVVYALTSLPTPSAITTGCACNCPPWQGGCPLDGGSCGGFNAIFGGLPNAGGGAGPSAGLATNVSTGVLDYRPGPDMTIYNPVGPSAVFRRSFRTDRAYDGYGSPGLSNGWVHNYDIKIDATSGSWGTCTLTYPSGATETFTPTLSGGSPTGAFTLVSKAPYTVTGTASGTPGVWTDITVTWQDRTKWKFVQFSGSVYKLVQITDRMGNYLTLGWDASRQLTSITNSASTTLLTLTYTSGKIQHIIDNDSPTHREVVYNYSGTDIADVSWIDLVGASFSAKCSYAYTTYSSQPFLNSITVLSPQNNSTNSTATVNYSNGRVVYKTDGNGHKRYYTYGTLQTRIEQRINGGSFLQQWVQKFNADYRNSGVIDALQHESTIVYTDTNNPSSPTTITDKDGKYTTYTYESNTYGLVHTVVSPVNTTTYNYSYSNWSMGEVSSVQRDSVTLSTMTYDAYGNLASKSIPTPGTVSAGTTVSTSYTYNSLGDVLTVTSPGDTSGTSIVTTYDYTHDAGDAVVTAKIGQPLSITDNLSHKWRFTYDSRGNRLTSKDPLSYVTISTFNLADQTLTADEPLTTGTTHGARTSYDYQYIGGPLLDTKRYDEDGSSAIKTVNYGLGKEGEKLSITGDTTECVNYGYDALYRLTDIEDLMTNRSTYSYDSVGRLVEIDYPGGGSDKTQFSSFDDAGRLLTRVDGNGQETEYTYDSTTKLLTGISYAGLEADNVYFSYDVHGRRSEMDDATGVVTYDYDDIDNLADVNTTYTDRNTLSIAYDYYADNQRKTMVTPSGTHTYYYDSARRLSSLDAPTLGTTSWSYKNNNWLDTQTLPTGSTSAHVFNGRGLETSLTHKDSGNTRTYAAFTGMTYDGNGDRTEFTAAFNAGSPYSGTTDFTYDSRQQMTEESSTRNSSYHYDNTYTHSSNPTTNPWSFRGSGRTYNSNNQITNTGYSYDYNGNPTTYKTYGATYDEENRLIDFNSSALTAAYNGNGLRAWKFDGHTKTYFLYDGEQINCELIDDGHGELAVQKFYVWGADGLFGKDTVDSHQTFYLYDPQGSVAVRIDEDENDNTDSLYDAWGILLAGSNPDAIGYNGKSGYYTDSETGLVLCTHRYYDPSNGKWLTRDPVGISGGMNLYGYIGNDVENRVDPSGYMFCAPAQLVGCNIYCAERGLRLKRCSMSISFTPWPKIKTTCECSEKEPTPFPIVRAGALAKDCLFKAIEYCMTSYVDPVSFGKCVAAYTAVCIAAGKLHD